MYGDIIPPKKKYHTEIIEDEVIHDEILEEHKSIHFTPIKRQVYPSYSHPRNKKIPILLTLLAVLVIGFGVYHKIFNGTTFTVEPKTTRFDIQQKIPLILQNREKDSLTYSLVYVPKGISARNPFNAPTATTTASTTSPKVEGRLAMTATTTGDVKNITLINRTTETVPLRIATRFDINGVTYTLDTAVNVAPTPKAELDTVAADTPMYRVIGFKDTSTYDTVYAIPAKTVNVATPNTTAPTTSDTSTSAIPPEDVLSLMPKGMLALQKSTIYDKLIDDSAVVVFDEKVLENFLNTTNIEMQEYFKVLKPFGSSISYSFTIVDYTLVTSPDTGKPVAFSNLSFDITPVIDSRLLPQQFAGFKKETMEKIQKQVEAYVNLDVSYTPFWSKAVADIERIHVK